MIRENERLPVPLMAVRNSKFAVDVRNALRITSTNPKKEILR